MRGAYINSCQPLNLNWAIPVVLKRFLSGVDILSFAVAVYHPCENKIRVIGENKKKAHLESM